MGYQASVMGSGWLNIGQGFFCMVMDLDGDAKVEWDQYPVIFIGTSLVNKAFRKRTSLFSCGAQDGA